MQKYFNLQLKRAAKTLPYLLVVLLITLVALVIIAGALFTQDASSDEKTKFKIAITGDTKGNYIQFGLTAVQNFDNTRFAMEIIELKEDEAREQLRAGKISAFVVLPENFIDRAMRGDIEPVKYVTNEGAQNVAVMAKNELTDLVTTMVVYSEKGVYSIPLTFEDYKVEESVNTHINNLSIEYTDLAFSRSNIYVVDELGIESGITGTQYYVCSIVVILLMLVGVAFVTIYVKNDYALPKLLVSKNCSIKAQVTSEYFVHFLTLFVLSLLLGVILLLCKDFLGATTSGAKIVGLLLRLIPVLFMIAAFNILIFEISSNIVTAVLLHFFGCVVQLYASGCFYPVYALPKILQKVSYFLPTGIARGFLEGAFTEKALLLKLLGLFCYTVLFFTLAVLIRKHKLLKESR